MNANWYFGIFHILVIKFNLYQQDKVHLKKLALENELTNDRALFQWLYIDYMLRSYFFLKLMWLWLFDIPVLVVYVRIRYF